jgi:hypothetical protein
MNQRLLALPFVDRIYVQPAASDAGTAIGAALEVLAERGAQPETMTHVYTGPSFSNEEIEKALESYKVSYRREEDVCRFAAEKLAQGNIVAWFQGAMEFGPRALGNRSILADPRDPAMKDRINATIKFREDFSCAGGPKSGSGPPDGVPSCSDPDLDVAGKAGTDRKHYPRGRTARFKPSAARPTPDFIESSPSLTG